MSIGKSLWVEKYRPRTLDDVIFSTDQQREIFADIIAKDNLPNLLLYGTHGTGKSTISSALINDLKIDPMDVLRINCSNKKVEAIRNEVSAFAMTVPMGSVKVVQLEELDYSSAEAFGLLRGLIEDTSDSCRFIATCNYVNRIMPALRSRFTQVGFQAPDKESIVLRMVQILEEEKVAFDVDDLLTYIDAGYPDVRQTIQLLQSNSVGGQLKSPSEAKTGTAEWKFELLAAIPTGDIKKARKIVCEQVPREDHETVFSFLYQNIDKLKVNSKDMALLKIAEYLYKHAFCADTEINLAALFIELGDC